MARHSHQKQNYLTPEDAERAKKALKAIEEFCGDASSRVIASRFGISHTAWENWRDGKHDIKASFARHVERVTLGQIKARDILGV